MKRSKHNLSHYRLTTANMGQIIPVACVPVLPGDTFQHQTSAVIRMSPLNAPVMHPTAVRIHHFFVPNRIIWDGWEDFITGGPDGMDVSEIPTITTTADKNNLAHQLGVPLVAGVEVSALPVYAFNKIFNEYYRDQDLVSERAEDAVGVARCSWEKDYFSTSRPWSQKGPQTTLPLGDTAPIIPDPADPVPTFSNAGTGANALRTRNDLTTVPVDWGTGSGVTAGDLNWSDPSLLADLANAVSPSVNDFRAAFAIQRYQEARARYGSRFTEYLRYLGIRPSDARLQRPEYLSGGTTRVNFSEVLQTANDPEPGTGARANIGVGDMYGHGIAGVRSNRYRKFFEEHGYVISCLSIRPKALYVNGIPREWLKTTKEDFFQKELANLGQQEVYQAELYAENTRDVFGFQDRYHEYRSHPSQVSRDFTDTLNAYHMGRDLQADVTLNEAFVECNPTDRIYQVSKSVADTCWVMVNNKIGARRMVPSRANPRII